MSNPIYDTKKKEPTPKKTAPKLEHFHLVTALAMYKRDDAVKQRHVNILLETASPNIMRADLEQINQGVLSRISTENNVQPEDLQDIVILNISRLAVSEPSEFYGNTQKVTSEEPVQ